jgi:hypothetical protein
MHNKVKKTAREEQPRGTNLNECKIELIQVGPFSSQSGLVRRNLYCDSHNKVPNACEERFT